jgi:hypothetical protein
VTSSTPSSRPSPLCDVNRRRSVHRASLFPSPHEWRGTEAGGLLAGTTKIADQGSRRSAPAPVPCLPRRYQRSSRANPEANQAAMLTAAPQSRQGRRTSRIVPSATMTTRRGLTNFQPLPLHERHTTAGTDEAMRRPFQPRPARPRSRRYSEPICGSRSTMA